MIFLFFQAVFRGIIGLKLCEVDIKHSFIRIASFDRNNHRIVYSCPGCVRDRVEVLFPSEFSIIGHAQQTTDNLVYAQNNLTCCLLLNSNTYLECVILETSVFVRMLAESPTSDFLRCQMSRACDEVVSCVSRPPFFRSFLGQVPYSAQICCSWLDKSVEKCHAVTYMHFFVLVDQQSTHFSKFRYEVAVWPGKLEGFSVFDSFLRHQCLL